MSHLGCIDAKRPTQTLTVSCTEKSGLRLHGNGIVQQMDASGSWGEAANSFRFCSLAGAAPHHQRHQPPLAARQLGKTSPRRFWCGTRRNALRLWESKDGNVDVMRPGYGNA